MFDDYDECHLVFVCLDYDLGRHKIKGGLGNFNMTFDLYMRIKVISENCPIIDSDDDHLQVTSG